MAVKRSEVATFINTGTVLVPVWALLGEGITSGAINYNPQTNSETYIHEDSGTTEIESYQPTMPVEAKHIYDDDALAYLDALRKTRPVLDDAHTEIVNVWLYETPSGDEYPAEKQSVSVQFDTYGGDGGQSATMNFTINYIGDPTAGTFDPTAKEFTPASES